MIITKQELRKYLDSISTFTGFNFEQLTDSKTTSRNINIGAYAVDKQLTSAYKRYTEDQLTLSAFHLSKAVKELAEVMSFRKLIYTSDGIQAAIDFANIAQEVIHGKYKTVIQNLKPSVAALYYDAKQFSITEEELAGNLDLGMASELVDELMTGNLVKTYVITGKSDIKFNTNVQWLQNILVTEDLTTTLNTLSSKVQTTKPDLLQVIPILSYNTKIELYSYFSIALLTSEGLTLLSDNEEFANPHAATTTRNPYRRREDAFERLAFPYDIIFDKKLGEHAKFPSTTANNFCTWQIPLNTIYWDSMLFMKMLVNMFVHMNKQDTVGNIKHVATFHNHLTQLTLPPTTSMTSKESFYIKKNDNYIGSNELLTDYEKFMQRTGKPSANKQLIVQSKELVTRQNAYNPDTLVTAERASQLIEYYGREQKRAEIQVELNKSSEKEGKRYSKFDIDIKNWLCEKVRENLDKLLPLIYSGTEHTFFEHSVRMSNMYTSFGNPDRKTLTTLSTTTTHGYTMGQLINEDSYFCIIDGDEHAREITRRKRLEFDNWEQICKLLDLKYEDLPLSISNFRTHRFKPSIGNTMLSDVDPLLRLRDPMSERYTNGLTLTIGLCRYADNRLQRKYKVSEQTVVTNDLQIIPYEEYKEQNKDSQISASIRC